MGSNVLDSRITPTIDRQRVQAAFPNARTFSLRTQGPGAGMAPVAPAPGVSSMGPGAAPPVGVPGRGATPAPGIAGENHSLDDAALGGIADEHLRRYGERFGYRR